MSVYLHGLSMRADLSANLKAVFMAMCDAAGEDDGTKCYPSLAYLSYKTGFSRRHTQRLIRTLEAAGYVEPVAFSMGGRGHATWYRIHMKRVPMKPAWNDVKRRLIEAGELREDDDIPQGTRSAKDAKETKDTKPHRKRAEAIKGDILSPINEEAVKGDILSPISTVKGDILSPISEERATFCHPSIPSNLENSYGDEDSYRPVSPSQKKEETGETQTAWELRPGDMPASRLWSRVIATLQPTTSAAMLASWIYPAHITRYGWDADKTLCVELAAPGSAHARMIEDRFGYLIADAVGRAYNLPASRVALSIVTAVAAPQVTRGAVSSLEG